MKYKLLFLLFICSFLSINAQTFDWGKIIGGTGIETINSVTKNPTGIFIVGSFQGIVDFNSSSGTNNFSSKGGKDVFVLKTDFDGNYLWAITFGGTGDDEAVSVIADNSGILIAGNFTSTVDFNPGSGTNNSTSNGGTDIFYVKLNNLGTYTYHKTIGGTADDVAKKIVFDGVNIPYLAGSFRNTVDFNPDSPTNNLSTSGGVDGFVMKINPSNGGLIWVKQFQSVGTNSYITINDIGVDSQSNIFIGGNFFNSVDIDPSPSSLIMTTVNLSNGTAQNVFLIKLDSGGNYLSYTTLRPTTSCDLVSLKIDSNDNIISTGAFSGNIDFNPGSAVNQINANGTTRTFVWKLTNSFVFGFVGSFSGNAANWPYHLYLDSNDAIYVSGQFSGSADFDINSPQNVLVSPGSYDAYFVKINSNTTFGFAKAVSGFDYNIGKAILVNGTSVYTFGDFKSTVDLNPDSAVQNVTSNGNYDIFYQRFTDNTLSSNDYLESSFKIFPNPTKNYLNVTTNSNYFSYQIYSIQGKVLQSGQSNTFNKIDVTKLNSGIYFLKASIDNQQVIKKFIKY
ncbi:T9SS type A sorting domain-containing protein [Polaribacter gangjinensis]|uniref:Secretion system C-terminal sorting domain-containing protein n=1 Tax=Polaribacter gangjinensis TaxID=574710 RepID=A0A2S7WB89_9FLAO|nr:T9SS type A sorting domain-containing protein [Polaribacter gangjinensis]PQJ74492.1 hypothetical protein BTO13_04070 [Polaribacter gangjinensis]